MKHAKHGKDKRSRRRGAVKGGTTRLISPRKATSAPANIEPAPVSLAANGSAMIHPQVDTPRVPHSLVEASDTKSESMWPGPFMWAIIILGIIFISIIAAFVHNMPEPG